MCFISILFRVMSESTCPTKHHCLRIWASILYAAWNTPKAWLFLTSPEINRLFYLRDTPYMLTVNDDVSAFLEFFVLL